MTTGTDCRGLEITAANDEAVAGFDRTVGAYLGLRMDTGDHLKATLEADPSFVMANVLRGYFMLLFASRKLLGRALSSLEAAREAVRESGCNRREELHVDALEAWTSGDQKRALAAWDTILTEWPRDVLALKLSEVLAFLSRRLPGHARSAGPRCTPLGRIGAGLRQGAGHVGLRAGRVRCL